MKFIWIVLMATLLCGCDSKLTFDEFYQKYSDDELAKLLIGSDPPVSKFIPIHPIRVDAKAVFSTETKDYVWKMINTTSGKDQLKYLSVYLYFNKHFMNKPEHEKINRILIENTGNSLVYLQIHFFYNDMYFSEMKKAKTFPIVIENEDANFFMDNLILLFKAEPSAHMLWFLIFFNCDPDRLNDLITESPLSVLIEVEEMLSRLLKRVENESVDAKILEFFNKVKTRLTTEIVKRSDLD